MFNHQDEPLQHALTILEQQLETPVVPGELDGWLETVLEHWSETGKQLRLTIEVEHPPATKEIDREDLELHRRVEQIREEDQQLLLAFDELTRDLQRLQTAVENVGPQESETKAEKPLHDLTERALAMVIRIRKQEQAIKTWLCESLERDRGDVD